MNDLLLKIRETRLDVICQLVAEVYERVRSELNRLEVEVGEAYTKYKAGGVKVDWNLYNAELDKIYLILDELECGFREINRVKNNLEKDYQEMMCLLKDLEILNPDGKSYTADYDGCAEAGQHGPNSPAGENFTGKVFRIPTQEQIIKNLGLEYLELYLQMERDGFQPKLLITPIACSIRKLADKLYRKRGAFKLLIRRSTEVKDQIQDEQLLYAPSSIKASQDGAVIEILGGKSKSEWIRENDGYLIDIVATSKTLEADSDIRSNVNFEINYIAVQAEKYAAKLKKAGFTPLSYETYLLAHRRSLIVARCLDDSYYNYTLLLDSNLRDGRFVSYARFFDDGVDLGVKQAGSQERKLRVRYSVRIPKIEF